MDDDGYSTSRKSHSRRSSSICSQSTRSSRKRHESTHKHKRVERKPSCSGDHDSTLHRLRKRVSRLVHEDRKYRQNDEPKQELPSCGCPNDCEAELEKLRKYVNDLVHLLPKKGESAICQLDTFVSDPAHLLSEAWTTLGASHLRDLVSADLLSICARREERDRKRSLTDKNELNATAPPPILSFDDENLGTTTVGVRELWKRSLLELRELSEDDIRAVLTGTFEESDKLSHQDLKRSLQSADNAETSEQVHQGPHKDICAPTKSDDLLRESDSVKETSTCEIKHLPAHQPTLDTPKTQSDEKVKTHSISSDLSTLKNGQAASAIASKVSGLTNGNTNPTDVRLMVQQEITELELRARAIRSLLKVGARSAVS